MIGLITAVCYINSIGVGGKSLSIRPEFLSNRRQRVRIDGKVSSSVDVVSGVHLVAF